MRIVLSIDRGNGTISGRLAVEGGPASSFHGWLELISTIERELDTLGGDGAKPAGGEVGAGA